MQVRTSNLRTVRQPFATRILHVFRRFLTKDKWACTAPADRFSTTEMDTGDRPQRPAIQTFFFYTPFYQAVFRLAGLDGFDFLAVLAGLSAAAGLSPLIEARTRA
jgi:hypothetical protein